MFERFTEKAIKVIMLAQEEARRMGHNFVGTEQILLGLIGEGTAIAAKSLKSFGVNLTDTRAEVEKIIGRGSGFVAVEIPFTPRAKRLLQLSWDQARELGNNYIGTEHLLLGLIREREDQGISEGVGARVLEALAVDFDALRDKTLALVKEATAAQESLDARRVALANNPSPAPATAGTAPGEKTTSIFNQGQPNFSRYTEKAIKVVMLAQEEARRLGHNFLGTEQILLGLIGEGTGIAAKTLKSMGVNLKDARVEVEKIIGRGSGYVAVEIPWTPRGKRVIELSWGEARQLGHNYIGTEHLLLGTIREGEGVAARVLENLGVDLTKVRSHVIRLLGEAGIAAKAGGAVDISASEGGKSLTPMLDQYCLNLIQLANDKELEPMIGRKQEMEMVMRILGRYAKSNAILVGEMGVGKSAIVRGLATAIANDDVPERFIDQRMIMLNLAGLAVESKDQSEFEDRFTKIMTEIGKTSNLILVIDELQILFEQTSSSKESVLGKIFKRALSNEQCSIIGITNLDDYRKHIERDAVLKNYCQAVIVHPASVQETIEILRGLKEKYEQHHQLTITDEALVQAVKLSDQDISERCLPDKAIDLIDEASSWVKQNASRLPPEAAKIKRQLQKVKSEKEQLIREQEFERAAKMREEETKLSEKLTQMKMTVQRERDKIVVNTEAVEHVLNSWTGKGTAKRKK